MDSGELIELFYNRAYEKFVNKQILDDKNYIVPRQQLTNYVHELVNIPFIDYIDYIKHNEIDRTLEPSDITQFSSFSTCELEMCKALLWANNPGCQYVDIGRLFPNKLISRSESAYRRYGEIHIKASTQLGLTFEYYNYWYLSCLGYIYPELDEGVRTRLLARTITRNRLYQKLIIDILDHDVNPEFYINIFPNYNFKRCNKSANYFLTICLNICRNEGIKVHNLIKRYEPPKEIIQDNPLWTNKRIDLFFIEIGREPLLSAYEEIELALKIRRGDIDARNKLVSANMRVVVGFVKQYLYKGLEFEDLLQEGFLGLIKAAEHFNEILGFKFIKYAPWWIRRYLSDAIITDSTIIRYPLNVRILHKRVNDFKVKYEHQYGFMPPATEIEIGNEDNHEIISFLNSLPNNLRNTCIPYDDLDVFENDHNDILEYENNEYNKYYVRSLLTRLSKRERDILIRLYGIGVREETLESVGDTFGLTRERVRQIKEKAIKKIRESIQSSYNREQDDLEDEELKETELTLEETERKKYVKKILKRAEKNDSDFSDHQKGEYNNVSPSLQEVNELDDIKVGDRIVYGHKSCTICKIFVRGKSSRFLVKYDNEVFDYVPNKKTVYRKVLSQQSMSSNSETVVDIAKRQDNNEVNLHRDKKTTILSYNGHEFKWNVGDIVTLGIMFSSSIAIQGDPFFLFRRNILFVFMRSRTANKNALDSNSYLLTTDTQNFKMSFSKKYGRRTPRILFFIHESPTAVQFLDEVKIRRIDANYIRFESLL